MKAREGKDRKRARLKEGRKGKERKREEEDEKENEEEEEEEEEEETRGGDCLVRVPVDRYLCTFVLLYHYIF